MHFTIDDRPTDDGSSLPTNISANFASFISLCVLFSKIRNIAFLLLLLLPHDVVDDDDVEDIHTVCSEGLARAPRECVV